MGLRLKVPDSKGIHGQIEKAIYSLSEKKLFANDIANKELISKKYTNHSFNSI